MPEPEFLETVLTEPSGRKLRRVYGVFDQQAQFVENAPNADSLIASQERPLLDPARIVRVENRSRFMAETPARLEPRLETPITEFQPQRTLARVADPDWSEEESPLSLEEQRNLAAEEEPHWSEPATDRWAREEEDLRQARTLEEARLEREKADRLARENAELIAREREEARQAKLKEDAALLEKQREESAFLAKQREEEALQAQRQEEALQAKSQEEAARLAKLREEEEALQAKRQEEAARLAKQREEEEALQAKRQEEAARLAKQREEEALLAKQREEEALQAKRREEAALLLKQQEAAALQANAQAETVRLARQKVEEARAAMAQSQKDQNELAREAARKVVTRQEANFHDQQKATPPPSASVIDLDSETDLNDSLLPETERFLPADSVAEAAPRMEEPVLERPSFVPSAPISPLIATNPRPLVANPQLSPRSASKTQTLRRTPVPALAPKPTPEVAERQLEAEEALLDEEQFDRGQKLLERQALRLEKEIQVAKKRQDLLKEQAKIRQKAEFNLGAWLAGAGPADLRECSDSERQKVCAIGYTVLVPTIFSLLSASYAASTLTTNPYVVCLVAVAWAVIILLVDRAIIATYSPNMSFLSKAGTIILRFVVAMLMGMTVSHPLTLLIFKDTINVQIEEERDQEISAAREKFAGEKKVLEAKVTEAQAEVERQRVLYNQSFDAAVTDPAAALDKAAASGTLTADEQVLLKQRTDDAAKPFQQELANLETSLQAAEAQRAKLQTEMDDWQRQYEAEIGGARSGVSGIGPRARSIETDQLSWRRADLQRLRDELATLTARRGEIQKSMTASGEALRREMETAAADRAGKARKEGERLAGLQQQLQEKKLQSLVSEGDNVRKGLQKAIDSSLEELSRRRRELDDLTALELKRMDDLRNNPRRDMLTQTLVMHKMFEHPEAGGHFALAAYLVLAALFLAIDTMPILVKFTAKKGEYDERRERATKLSAIPAELRKHDPIDAQSLRDLVLEYDRQEQQLRVLEMHAKALEQQEIAYEKQGKVHAKEKEVYEKERDAMHAKADRDAALTFKNLEIAERERARQQELAEQERKLVVAQQQAELEKLELAAKEAETNEAKAKAHLSQLNLEIVQNDAKGLLKHQLQEAQVERGRERFAKKDKDKDVVVAPEVVAAEPDLSSEVAEAEA